ncbi:tetratricopeptide repeat protein 10, tpr10, putative, partial [Perkinsus marinus ATCC 50983]
MAIKIDRYNCEALVNKGNCLFVCNELYRAKELYLEAIGVASYCLEAIYNLGLVCKQACEYNEALIAFTKLQEITKNNCDVLWQLGDIYHKISNYKKAHEYLSLILTQGMARGRPNDPTVLARIGELYEIEGNEVEAYHNYMESYRNWPLDLTVITWLGVYYVKKDLFESAIPLFKRASDISPSEPKWMLMIASCYRRMGNQQKAYNMYEHIYRRFPHNIEPLRYLVSICKDMGNNTAYEQYMKILNKLQHHHNKDEDEQCNRLDKSEENDDETVV